MLPQTATAERPSRTGGALTVLGGVVVLASSFMEWGRPTVGAFVVQTKGGALGLFGGIVLIALGLLLMLARARGGRLALAILTMIAAVLMSLVAVFFVASDEGYRTVWASKCAGNRGCLPNLSSDEVKRELDRLIDDGRVTFDPNRGAGIYVALAGGLLALIGGIAGLRRGGAVARHPIPGAVAGSGASPMQPTGSAPPGPTSPAPPLAPPPPPPPGGPAPSGGGGPPGS